LGEPRCSRKFAQLRNVSNQHSGFPHFRLPRRPYPLGNIMA
jgi:hypothetical protein